MSTLDYIFALVIFLLFFVVGAVFGLFMNPDTLTGTDPNQGLPIHDLYLSEDGLTLTFYIETLQWQATLTEATSRPPNLATATRLFVEENRLLFLTPEGQNIFGKIITYADSLRLLEG